MTTNVTNLNQFRERFTPAVPDPNLDLTDEQRTALAKLITAEQESYIRAVTDGTGISYVGGYMFAEPNSPHTTWTPEQWDDFCADIDAWEPSTNIERFHHLQHGHWYAELNMDGTGGTIWDPTGQQVDTFACHFTAHDDGTWEQLFERMLANYGYAIVEQINPDDRTGWGYILDTK